MDSLVSSLENEGEREANGHELGRERTPRIIRKVENISRAENKPQISAADTFEK